ncbi:hypothetical protein L1049_011223 [Liquidambar formosana]|uniref:Uncharacterized protein n=1 Tax=Liquidambar formosana TaxID=63359 RepID=A0AAP0RR90_LIQFO
MANPEWACGVPPNISVVGDGFCVPYPVELIVKKRRILENTHFDVFDVNGNLFLRVNGSVLTFSKKRVMRGTCGYTYYHHAPKLNTSKFRWMVHRGESSEQNSLLFSVVRPFPFQMRKQLDVFLASNPNERTWDFRVIGCNFSQSFKVFRGNSVIAEINHDFTWGRFLKGKSSFRVSINPSVDYAFIVTLLVILNEDYLV